MTKIPIGNMHSIHCDVPPPNCPHLPVLSNYPASGKGLEGALKSGTLMKTPPFPVPGTVRQHKSDGPTVPQGVVAEAFIYLPLTLLTFDSKMH